ncbi:hypothetical protein, partial [Enterobacter hormaechei]|uniref:hypothetical protein n=1 Tax=Enterobacter hormaechei TaxID=158836 RepID=UPI00203E1434
NLPKTCVFLGYNVNVFIFVHIDADDDFQVPDWHVGQCQSGTWRTIGGKLKVTQLSTTGYLGQFDFCAIARMGNAEDAH